MLMNLIEKIKTQSIFSSYIFHGSHDMFLKFIEYFKNIYDGFEIDISKNQVNGYLFMPVLSDYGKKILDKYAFNLSYGQGWLRPFKCIPVERSKHS